MKPKEDDHLKRMAEENARGEHFSWTHCPWCWAERNIKALIDERMVS